MQTRARSKKNCQEEACDKQNMIEEQRSGVRPLNLEEEGSQIRKPLHE